MIGKNVQVVTYGGNLTSMECVMLKRRMTRQLIFAALLALVYAHKLSSLQIVQEVSLSSVFRLIELLLQFILIHIIFQWFISLGTGCNFDREQNWSSTPVTPCTDNASCEDGDSCTINTCGIDGKCTTAPSSSCSSKSIVCGSSRGNCRATPVNEASPNTLHEVRCCREGQSGSWNRKYNTCPSDIWGESILPSGVGCVHSATYDEAETYCSNAGGRLCTKDELLADCTRGSGCSHDHDYM